jgi:hypothetical protein
MTYSQVLLLWNLTNWRAVGQRASALVRPAVVLEQAAELPESARSETIDQYLCGFARFRERRAQSGAED